MTPEEWRQVRRVFDAALKRDPEERSAFLDEACAGNPRLRAEVEALLDSHDQAGDFIEAPLYQAAAHLLTETSAETMPGREVGPYIIRHEIGRGGMGVVYLADDTRLGRRVALKAIAPDLSRDAGHRDRLWQEARAAAALSHSGIATLYALEEIGGELYLSYEYVPGQTLRALVKQGPVALPEIVDISKQLARALAAAHGQGIVHRDLKPENVVRTSAGIVKVLDFGIARADSLTPTRLTQPGTILGTPAYMAPEQARGQDADFRSDLFSLGVVVYEMASGSNPFEADTVEATIARVLEIEPDPLSDVRPGCLPELDRIVAVCLRKHPLERYGSTQELVTDLERLETTTPAPREQKGSGRGLEAPQAAITARGLTPRWWWEFHQAVVSLVYALMIYPTWRVRSWLPQPWGTLFLLVVLACAAAATTLRLHLWFTARFNATELSGQLARTMPWLRWCDAGFAASLVAAAVGIGGDRPEIAMLLVTVAVAAAIASFVIEPTRTRAAFRGRTGAFRTPSKR